MSINECLNLYSSSDLVITSYMHGGITAFASGTPAIFIMPKTDIKTLDILASIKLDPEKHFINMFDMNELKFNFVCEKIDRILENPLAASKSVRIGLDSEYHTIFKPMKHLKFLLDGERI